MLVSPKMCDLEQSSPWVPVFLGICTCADLEMREKRKEAGGPIHFKPTANSNSLLESQPTKELSPCSSWYTSAGEQTTLRLSGKTQQARILVCGWAGWFSPRPGSAPLVWALSCVHSELAGWLGTDRPTSSGLIRGVSPGSVRPSSHTFAQVCSLAGQGMWPEGLLDSGLEVTWCHFCCSVLAKACPLFC